MAAALPHIDALVSGHSLDALDEVVEAIGAERGGAGARPDAPRREDDEPWASATPVPGSSVAMPSGYGPSRGRTTSGVEPRVTAKTCIYPGCERPAVPPHPLGGPQPSFCDLEEHNALTAHQERERLEREQHARGGPAMADKAYRAVFLRVHPTGKMVLSLTTRPTERGHGTRNWWPTSLGVPPLDVKVVPADEEPVWQLVTATAPARPEGPPRGGGSAPAGKILDKAKLLAGVALEAPPDQPGVGRRCLLRARAEAETIADIALYAHGTGALPPGVEGGLDAQTVYGDAVGKKAGPGQRHAPRQDQERAASRGPRPVTT